MFRGSNCLERVPQSPSDGRVERLHERSYNAGGSTAAGWRPSRFVGASIAAPSHQHLMTRPRLIRGLRIAWSVWWGILCVLLVVLWVRSYWFKDELTVEV